MTKRPKRPRDPIALAKLIGDIATGQAEDTKPIAESAAAALGKKGGAARAAKLSPQARQRAAKKAAQARWAKKAEPVG